MTTVQLDTRATNSHCPRTWWRSLASRARCTSVWDTTWNRINFNELAKGWPTDVGRAVDEYELQDPPDEQLADVSEAREKDSTGERKRVKTQNFVKGSTRRCLPRTITSEGENIRSSQRARCSTANMQGRERDADEPSEDDHFENA